MKSNRIIRLCRILPVAVLGFMSCGRQPEETARPRESVPAAAEAGERSPAPSMLPAAAKELETRLELARALRKAGKREEAEAEFRKVLESDPASLEARLELAQLLAWRGQRSEAALLVKDVGAEEGGTSLLSLHADMAVAEGRFEEAAELLGKLASENPDNEQARFQRAQVLSWLKRYGDSLREYEALLARRPEDLQLRRHYAQVLGWSGRHERSAEELRKTLP